MNDTLLYLGGALHNMQAERGCSVLFVSSKGTLFKNELQEAFHNTQEALDKIRQGLKGWHDAQDLNEELLSKINIVLESSEKLTARRNKIRNLEYNFTEIIGGYSHNVISPLMDIMVIVALFNKDNDPARVSAYSYFLQLKEKFSRERALGARGLATGSFNNKEFIDRFCFLISEQDSFKRTFLALADDKQKKIYAETVKGESVLALDKIRASIKKGQRQDFQKLSPTDWFHMTSEKIRLLKLVEEDLLKTLIRHDFSTDGHVQASQIQTGHIMGGINAEQRAFIEQLPFFTGLPNDIISGLLQHAQVRDYKKGQLLFLEGEVSTRLHIILEGWVKLFKGTSSGNETILQMLTSGDMVAESAIFLSANYPVSAQIAKKSIIMTIPAPIIRERIKEHNELALRVLAAISQHSHNLIQEFENIRLKPATERVGWYLLKLLLDQGKIPDLIELPYDKSLIASYLDMKPETFSRTLKRFKKNGFVINKSSVILPDVNALCGFCDHDLAPACAKHKTPECPNPDCNGENISDF